MAKSYYSTSLLSDFQHGFKFSCRNTDLLTVAGNLITKTFGMSCGTRAVTLDVSGAIEIVWHADLHGKNSGKNLRINSPFLSHMLPCTVLDGSLGKRTLLSWGSSGEHSWSKSFPTIH